LPVPAPSSSTLQLPFYFPVYRGYRRSAHTSHHWEPLDVPMPFSCAAQPHYIPPTGIKPRHGCPDRWRWLGTLKQAFRTSIWLFPGPFYPTTKSRHNYLKYGRCRDLVPIPPHRFYKLPLSDLNNDRYPQAAPWQV